MLLTDGMATPGGEITNDILNQVKQAQVKVVTIAFGKSSEIESRLEELARVSGGKTYFIPLGEFCPVTVKSVEVLRYFQNPAFLSSTVPFKVL